MGQFLFLNLNGALDDFSCSKETLSKKELLTKNLSSLSTIRDCLLLLVFHLKEPSLGVNYV